MIITENTRISEIIKHDSRTIDVIASINKHFKKLKNPVLRKDGHRRFLGPVSGYIKTG